MESHDFDATLISRRDVGPDVAFFDVELDAPLEPNADGQAFLPGQYVTVSLPGPDGALVRRPMTLTSTPRHPKRIELLLNRVANPASEHPLSHLLFALAPGARLAVRRVATGTFTLEHTAGADAETALFVASGTGIAPFLSMLRHRLTSRADVHGFALIQVAASSEATIAGEELARMPGLSHRVLVGDPAALFDDPAALEAQVNLRITPEATPVLACGLGRDLRALALGLLRRGYVPRHRRLLAALGVDAQTSPALFLEQYDSERLFDTKDAATVEDMKARFQPPAPR